NQHIVLVVLGGDGRATRVEAFDDDHEAEALARFDELGNPSVPPVGKARIEEGSPRIGVRIENAATRAADRFGEAMQALDMERFAALLAPGFRNVDRRRIVSTDLTRDQFLESFEFVFSRLSSATVASEVLATRGDRLALFRMCVGFTE